MKIYKSNFLILSFYLNSFLMLLTGIFSYLTLLLFPVFGIARPIINKYVFLSLLPFFAFLIMKLAIGLDQSNHFFDAAKGIGVLVIFYLLFSNIRISNKSILSFLVVMTYINILIIFLDTIGIDFIGRSRDNQFNGLFDEPSAFGIVTALSSYYFLKNKYYLFWFINLVMAFLINSLTGFIACVVLSLMHVFFLKRNQNILLIFIIFLISLFIIISPYLSIVERIYNELFIIFQNTEQIDLSGRGSSSQMRLIFEFLFLNEAINNASYLNLLFGSFDHIEYRTASLNGIVEIILRYGFIGLFLIIYALSFMLIKKIISIEFILCILLVVFSTGAIYKLSFIFYIFIAYKALTFSK